MTLCIAISFRIAFLIDEGHHSNFSYLRKIYFHSIFIQFKNNHVYLTTVLIKRVLSRLIRGRGRKVAASLPLPFRYLRSTDHTETVGSAPRYSRRLVRTRATVRRSFMNLLDWDFLTREHLGGDLCETRKRRGSSFSSFLWLSRVSLEDEKNWNYLFILVLLN